MDEFWSKVIYRNPAATHVCGDFGAVLACNGKSDVMMCQKCGKGWIAPCALREKKKRKTS